MTGEIFDSGPKGAAGQRDAADCTFLYFKPGGKWKYDGRGRFPDQPFFGRDAIMAANDGVMPGILGDASDMIVVVIPDANHPAPHAFPRMLRELA